MKRTQIFDDVVIIFSFTWCSSLVIFQLWFSRYVFTVAIFSAPQTCTITFRFCQTTPYLVTFVCLADYRRTCWILQTTGDTRNYLLWWNGACQSGVFFKTVKGATDYGIILWNTGLWQYREAGKIGLLYWTRKRMRSTTESRHGNTTVDTMNHRIVEFSF